MKRTRKLLLANMLMQVMPNRAISSQVFLLFLVSTFVIQQELSSYSYVVARALIDEYDATTTNAQQGMNQSNYIASTNNLEQQHRDIQNNNNNNNGANASAMRDNLQSTASSTTTLLQPEAAAISSPLTSHLKPPVIVSKPEEIIVAPGSNVTLTCSAQGSQPLTFVWFQDEKNLTKSNAPSTKLLEEKRYEIFEEIGTGNTTNSILYLMNLRLTDTSLFLCWVENGAGYTFENYSLVVNDSLTLGQQAHTMTTNLYQTPPNGMNGPYYLSYPVIIIGLVLLVLAAIICTGLQVYTCRQDRDDQQMASKSRQANEYSKSISMHEKSLSSSSPGGKYTPSTMDSADDEEEEEEDDDNDNDDDDDVSQTSSCNKNNLRVLAVNDLDGFIEQMRSGIINMDYHSMSPIIQFNKNGNQYSGHQETPAAAAQPTGNGNQLRTQSSLLATEQQPAFQQQQLPQQVYSQQQYQTQSQPFGQTYATQQLPQSYQMQQQHNLYQQTQPFHHLQQQQGQIPQQSYHQLAYMNHFPSSSSSSSQTPFTTSYNNGGGNGYYY